MGYQRFIDRADKYRIIQECKDFFPRSHGTPPKWLLYGFICLLFVIVININLLSFELILLPDGEPKPADDILIFLFTVSAILLTISILFYFFMKRFYAIILQTEFTNLLFSRVATLNSAFCLVTTRDQMVVFSDEKGQTFFHYPEENADPLELLLSSNKLNDEQKASIISAVTLCKPTTIPFEYSEKDGSGGHYKLKVSPLKRPEGYSVIRAYKAS